MSQSSPKVSVIIPVYNVENELRECLDSIINQTLRDIEIICVDDGSTDSSLEILREYEEKDERLQVLTQENQFAGVARNHGMEHAKGQYYIFLDSDDCFELEMLEKMVAQAEAFDADICLCAADKLDTLTGKHTPMSWTLNLKEVRQQPFCAADLKRIFRVSCPAPWSKLFSADFVRQHQLQFQNTPRNNDMYFTYCAMALAEKIVYVDEIFVHYRIGQNTNLQSGLSKTPTVCCEVLQAIKNRLEGDACWEIVKDAFLNAAAENLEYNVRLLNDYPEAKRELLEAIDGKYFQEFGLRDYPIEKINERERYNHLCLELLCLSCENPLAPQVSIVVPVFNAEEYVAQCLESLLKQTLKNIEIICVDDASTDSSRQILRTYAEHDARVCVIEKENNEGCVCARRTGVLASKGKYIMFSDPDDFLDPLACETAYKAIVEKKADILQFTCGVEDHDNNEQAKKWLENYLRAKDQVLNRTDLQNGLFLKRDIATALVGKIYDAPKCKLACRNMPEIYCNIGEDLYQQFYYSSFCDSFAGVSTMPLYWYRRGLGVSNSRGMSLGKYETYCAMAKLYDQVSHFARQIRKDSFLVECAEALGTRMCEDCVRNWMKLVPEEEKADAFKLFWRYWRHLPERNSIFTRMTGEPAKALYETYVGIPKYVKPAARYTEDPDWKPAVSVIIPIYNVEDYLHECLDSIVGQTLENIEIICVNDGSTDESLSIAEEYREKDPRITIVSRANSGQSAARNIGMQYAKGYYIYFIDSDDVLDVEALKKLEKIARANSLSVLRFGIKPFYSSKEIHYSHSFDSYYESNDAVTEVLSGVEYIKDRKDKGEYLPSPCISLMNRGFLKENNLTFREGIIHEDNLFSFQLLMAAERVFEIQDTFYKRRVREGSTMTSALSAKNVIGYFSCAEGVLAYAVNNSGDPTKEQEIKREYNRMLNAARRDYKALSAEEKEKVIFATDTENELFKQLVKDWIYQKEMEEKVKKRNKEIANLKGKLKRIKGSTSYRIGRAITWLPRKVRGGVRCLRQHGMRYTFARLLLHLHLGPDNEKRRK